MTVKWDHFITIVHNIPQGKEVKIFRNQKKYFLGSYWIDSFSKSSSGVEQTVLNMGSGMPQTKNKEQPPSRKYCRRQNADEGAGT